MRKDCDEKNVLSTKVVPASETSDDARSAETMAVNWRGEKVMVSLIREDRNQVRLA